MCCCPSSTPNEKTKYTKLYIKKITSESMGTKLDVHKLHPWLWAHSAVLCSCLLLSAILTTQIYAAILRSAGTIYLAKFATADLNSLTKGSQTPEYRLVWVDSMKMLLLKGIYLSLSHFKSLIPTIRCRWSFRILLYWASSPTVPCCYV